MLVDSLFIRTNRAINLLITYALNTCERPLHLRDNTGWNPFTLKHCSQRRSPSHSLASCWLCVQGIHCSYTDHGRIGGRHPTLWAALTGLVKYLTIHHSLVFSAFFFISVRRAYFQIAVITCHAIWLTILLVYFCSFMSSFVYLSLLNKPLTCPLAWILEASFDKSSTANKMKWLRCPDILQGKPHGRKKLLVDWL